MNISNQIELSQFNVRNVSQKQIYDSYMGILRISPNTMYGRDTDDPTSILNTLVDFNGIFYTNNKNKHITVRLSDSDGNLLPIYFVPKAFKTENVYDGLTYSAKNLINLCTEVYAQLFVSNKMTERSTIVLRNPQENKTQFFIASDVTDEQASSILCFPLEAPNDDDFFNNKNKLYLFDQSQSSPRHEQMDDNLYNKDLSWYYDKDLQKSQVEVGGKLVTDINYKNESVPVLYTHDYVLGHYDGHSWSNIGDSAEVAQTKVNELIKNTGENIKLKENGNITRLSWIRFDNLIWQYLNEVLNGCVRSTKGRYTQLGVSNNSSSFFEQLFGEDKSLQDLTLTAPILGQGVQRGLISYHAMPFHRYWFHRNRQVVKNLKEWQKEASKDVTEIKWSQYYDSNYDNDDSNDDSNSNTTTIQNQFDELQEYYKNQLITPCCSATITSHHSLAKNFLLCDGKKISSFKNYPNISLKNEKYFEIETSGAFVRATKNENGLWYFPQRTASTIGKNQSVYPLMYQTQTSGAITNYTPALYVLHEKYPRFIRGLNWVYDDVQQDYSNYSTYNKTLSNNTNYFVHSASVMKNGNVENKETYNYPGADGESFNKDAFGKNGIDIVKNINKICTLNTQNGVQVPHSFNFEYLTNVDNHYHLGFGSRAGGEGNEDKSKEIIQEFYRQAKYYQVFTDKCLWDNPSIFYLPRGAQWANYCLSNKTVFFDNYTPVPNMGYMLFNPEIYNAYNREQKNGDVNYKGTIKNFQHNWSKSGYGYFDAQNKWYPLTIEHSIKPTHAQAKNLIKKANHTQLYTNLEEHRISKIKRKQLAMKLNESQGRIPISQIGKAQFGLYSKHFHQWKKRTPSWLKILFVLAFGILGGLIGWAFGGIFIGATIGLGVGIYLMDKLLRGRWKVAWSHSYRYGIGKYQLASFTTANGKVNSLQGIIPDNNQGSTSNETDISWQCVTSLPYDDPEYLGYGQITKINSDNLEHYNNITFDNPREYYITHNVTDLWNAYTNTKNYGYQTPNDMSVENPVQSGGPQQLEPDFKDENDKKKNSKITRQQSKSTANYAGTTIDMQIDSPYPSHLNLIPLIRI